jgi:hypothetical protein
MNTTQQFAGQGAGCSTTVAAMLAVLGLIVGLLIGAGGLFGFLKADEGNAVKLGVAPSAKARKVAPLKGAAVAEPVQAAECPACPRCEVCASNNASAQPGYALVYPIEETLRIEGELDTKIIRDKVLRSRFDLQKCYQSELKRSAGLTGEISLQFTVDSAGKIFVAVARQNTTQNKALEACVLTNVKTWSFERKPGSKDAVVKFDILFTTLNPGGMGP